MGPRRFVLVGHPVAHSLSPEIHRAAYRVLGLEHRYDLVDAPDEAALARVVDALRAGELDGANVTVPWKRAALALCDRADALARDAGAANVLTRAPDGAVVASNTDAPALADELARLGARPGVASVIGSGGAALSAVMACRALGVARVVALARRWTAVTRAGFERLGAEPAPFDRVPADSAIVVQATSAGMVGADAGDAVAALVDWERLPADAVGYDVVYDPPLTPFVAAARRAGRVAESGLGMLIGQAVRAMGIWLGATPPAAPLREAARRAIAARRTT
ncbi:MAG: shikimate dehydrogenase [Sorangiineae bacterium]|nr:shikimate dehydrogenase [Polyangiaceae bacterium]MEB2320892.1 shikimate dehydrogenase [Sorangiineae bacterium]